MTIVSIKEDFRIVDRGGSTFVGELFHGLNMPVSIHVSRWCVVECPVQWDVVNGDIEITPWLVEQRREA